MKKSTKKSKKQFKGIRSLSEKHRKHAVKKHTPKRVSSSKKQPKKPKRVSRKVKQPKKHTSKRVSRKVSKKQTKKQKGGNGEYVEVSGIDVPANSDLGLSGLSISKMLAKIFDSECNKTKKTKHFMPK